MVRVDAWVLRTAPVTRFARTRTAPGARARYASLARRCRRVPRPDLQTGRQWVASRVTRPRPCLSRRVALSLSVHGHKNIPAASLNLIWGHAAMDKGFLHGGLGLHADLNNQSCPAHIVNLPEV